jgi:hypothetical protein
MDAASTRESKCHFELLYYFVCVRPVPDIVSDINGGAEVALNPEIWTLGAAVV